MKQYIYNRYTVRLNDDLNEFIKQKAKKNGISEQNAIRLIIAAAMEVQEDGRLQKTI